MIWIYLFFFGIGSCFLIFQIFYWLKKGFWISLPIWYVFDADRYYNETKYQGWNKIVTWLLDTNISITLFSVGLFLILMAALDESQRH
jgi:hypothetical protein